jgi:ABC-type nitrate/sulfonate/bicarbonate transport system permease component
VTAVVARPAGELTAARRASRAVRRWSGWLVIIGILLAWELWTRVANVPPYLLPPPSRIAGAMVTNSGRLATELGITLFEALAGFALGSATAMLLSVAVLRSRTFEVTALPPIMILQSVPIVAITPVLAAALGRTTLTAVVIVAIICFFPVMVNAVRGLRSVSDESLELMHVLDASPRQQLLELRLPASLPSLFGGLRVAATICFPGAMIAEWITAARGLGYYIVDMQVRYRTELVWAGIVTATLTGVALFTIVTLVERRLLRWHDAESEHGALL